MPTKPIVLTRQLRCVSSREDLWPALADTHQLNRALGNHTLESEPISRGATRYLVKTRLAGLKLEYEESPFEWSKPESLSVTRTFRNGPALCYTFALRLSERENGGALVSQRLDVEPKSALVWLFVYANTALIARRLAKEIRRIDANLAKDGQAYTEVIESKVDRTLLSRTSQRLIESLQNNRADDDEIEIAQRMVRFIGDASDESVARIRPFEIAEEWGVDRRSVVTVCLEAVVAGLLEFSWDIICPSCRTVALQLTSLSQLKEQSHCHLCDISIGIEFDRAVEATFRPATAIRPLPDRPYCIGGPFRTPHIVAQARLPAGGTTSVQVPNQAGRYRLFVRGGAFSSIEIAPGAQRMAEITAGKTAQPSQVVLAPGGSLLVRDGLDEERHVKLEHLEWASVAATPPFVSTVSTFRRLFSAEVLRAGLKIKVAHVALLFTDLTNSTAMYMQHGDATAYRFVREHFAVLQYVIDGHRGTVVKTIGDAVMAAFCDERDAIEAAIDLQRAYRSLLAVGRDEAQDVELCVGVYAGTSYLMNANGALDYFGQTVNTASRLQSACHGGQIVLPAEMAARGQADGWLAGADIVDRFDADLKGIAEPITAVRLSVQGV